MKTFVLTTFFAAVISSTLIPTAAAENLHVHSWPNYFDRQVVSEFEKKFGIQVMLTNYSSEAELDSELNSGIRFDVIVTSTSHVDRLVQDNRLAPLDFLEIPNRAGVGAELLLRLSSKNMVDLYAIPYTWSTVRLVLNKSLIEKTIGSPSIPQSWSILFDPEYSKKVRACGAILHAEPEQILSIYMNYKGKNLNNSSARNIRTAAKEVRDLELAYNPESSIDVSAEIEHGTACVAMARSHLAASSHSEQSVHYLIPEEGSLLLIDSLTIPGNATNVPAAQRFINFMLEPENAKRNSGTSQLASSLASDSTLLKSVSAGQETRKNIFVSAGLTNEQKAALEEAWSN